MWNGMKDFDYIVIGGGSGGIASARRAAAHGAKVALVEAKSLGGTCVNVGCVPKKLMWNAADIARTLRDAASYGFDGGRPNVDWSLLKSRRDAAVGRLQGVYRENLENSGVTIFAGRAKLLPGSDPIREVDVDAERLRARHVLLATGGSPRVPNISGAQLGITSNGFFELESQPKRVAIVGAGYIGVELASILRLLGSEVTLFSRGPMPLARFDSMIQEEVLGHLRAAGVDFLPGAEPERVLRAENGSLKVAHGGGQSEGFDTLLWATGRSPNSRGLGLEALGVDLDDSGHVLVDALQNTTRAGVYSLGDVTGRLQLTPVAIGAGRALADRLFGNVPDRAFDYDSVPTVVFGIPPVATVGMSEGTARERLGDDVAVPVHRFVGLYYALGERRPKTAMKLVVERSTDRVRGVHIVGLHAEEMIQGVAIAVRMGATKADFERTVAVHPTAAEELVTMR
jgi:glutathione reductase (NADPH)